MVRAIPALRELLIFLLDYDVRVWYSKTMDIKGKEVCER